MGGVLWPFVIVLGRPPGPPLAERFRVAQVLGRDGGLAGKLVLGPHLLPPRWSGDGEGAEGITASVRLKRKKKPLFSPFSFPLQVACGTDGGFQGP